MRILKIYEDEFWRLEANCRGVARESGSFDKFFPLAKRGRGTREPPVPPEVKVICDACTVSEQCLDYALRNHESEGIWGGLSPDQRKNFRRNFNQRYDLELDHG